MSTIASNKNTKYHAHCHHPHHSSCVYFKGVWKSEKKKRRNKQNKTKQEKKVTHLNKKN